MEFGVRHSKGIITKVLISLVFLCVPCCSIFAVSLYLEPFVSYNREHITYDIYSPYGSINSRLEWNADYLFKTGTTFNLEAGPFVFNSSVAFNLPFKCGVMYDSDWYTIGLKTNRSTSDIIPGFGIDCNLDFGYKFDLPRDFSVTPVLSIQESYRTLHAENTIGLCGDMGHTALDHNIAWDDPRSKKVKKYGIDFYHNTTGVYLGADVAWAFSSVQLDLAALFSPFTYIFSVDHHLGKQGGHYYQMIQKALAFDFRFSALYNFSSKSALKLAASYNFCPDTPGDFYFGWFATDHIIADETCSLSFSKLNILLSWQIKIK